MKNNFKKTLKSSCSYPESVRSAKHHSSLPRNNLLKVSLFPSSLASSDLIRADIRFVSPDLGEILDARGNTTTNLPKSNKKHFIIKIY